MSTISKILLYTRMIAYAAALILLFLLGSSFCHPVDSPFDFEAYSENASEDYYKPQTDESVERYEKKESARQMQEDTQRRNDIWARENGYDHYSGGTTDWGNDRSRD